MFAQFFATYGVTVLGALDTLDQTREQITREVEDSPIAESLSERDIEKLIHTRSWEDLRDEITAQLTATSVEVSRREAPQPTRGFAFESSLSAEEIAEILDEVHEETDNS